MYVREHTAIPVPRVYTYDADAKNPVGAVYSLQERVRSSYHFGKNESDLFRFRFPAYLLGQIYFTPGTN